MYMIIKYSYIMQKWKQEFGKSSFKTRTATRSHRGPGNEHFISVHQVSPTRSRYAAAAAAYCCIMGILTTIGCEIKKF